MLQKPVSLEIPEEIQYCTLPSAGISGGNQVKRTGLKLPWQYYFIGVIPATLFFVAHMHQVSAQTLVGTTGLLLVPVGIILLLKKISQPKGPKMDWDRFWAANNLEIVSLREAPGYAGLPFQGGRDWIVNASRGQFKGKLFEIGWVNYITGLGTGTYATPHCFTYVRVGVEKNLPHVTFDNKFNYWGPIRKTDFIPKGGWKVKLPPQYSAQLTMRSLNVKYGVDQPDNPFTVAVVDALAALPLAFDIECIGQEVYLYNGKADENDPETMQKLIESSRIAQSLFS